VLALAYAAACADEWETAAELLGSARAALRRDTAGYIHHALATQQLVRPHLDPAVFDRATTRGTRTAPADVLTRHGV
jgi:hypothetical protein